ncbi:lipopolysaccharide export system protein LptA [Pedobacter sp. UYP30]|uniref:OstA-like protein n=1 Tax=Pedobacter sp. UYP30 TaxID=1756400 RepID=UPI003393CB63
MQKLLFLLLLVFGPLLLSAQQKSVIKIVSFEQITGVPEKKVSYLRRPVFQQDNATLTCDSAVYYSERNYFEAYNNVHILQQETNIYSNQLQYDGNTKKAHLTGNVKMIDPQAILTTDILDYDMAAKIGTYNSGGKIVNKDITLTSRNGYYFSNSNDAYFRYNVVAITPQTTIKSDTMRYNTQSKWTYFYGPTNIKGKDDNLYTENGAYNTQTQDAYFGKKNLYTQDTKSLKGDSLYYYGAKGYGKAVKNIVFGDTKDKIKMFGDLGYYYKADKRALVTKKAYLGIGTADSIVVNGKKKPDSLWIGADTLITQMVLRQTLKLVPKISVQADNKVGEDEPEKPGKSSSANRDSSEVASKAKNISSKKLSKKQLKKERNRKKKESDKLPTPLIDSLKKGADSLGKDVKITQLDSLPAKNELKATADSIVKNLPKPPPDSVQKKLIKKADSLLGKGKADLSKLPDGVKKKILDSAKAKLSKLKAAVKNLPKPPLDSVQKKLIKKADSLLGKGKADLSKLPDSVKKPILDSAKAALSKLKAAAKLKDSIKLDPLDTVQARVINAFHHVKVFKSNIQAKTDSLFYTSADSTLRCYVNPIVWAEGSQQVGDTIYVQFKNKKLNNMQAIRNAFLVNTPKDSLRFNQIKGRLLTGFFADGQLKTMYVDGNAESIYYTQDDSTKVYKEVNQTLSSRIKFTFKDKDIDDVVYIKGVEGAINPDSEVAKDNVLTGFSWKPKERPKSKKDAITPSPVIKVAPKAKGKQTPKTEKGGKLVPKEKQIEAKPKNMPEDAVQKVNVDSLKLKEVPPKVILKPDTNNFGIKPILPKKDTVGKSKSGQ